MADPSGIELSTYPGLDRRITIIRAGTVVDAVFIRTERFDVLVDTLGTPEECRAALELLGVPVADRPLIVVNSHMDWDHFWGNSAVAGRAQIIAHEAALKRFHDPAARRTLQAKAEQDPRFQNVALVAPTISFSDRLALNGGDLTLELVHTPGHTPDHVAVWIPELRVCLAVDAAELPIPEVWSDDPADLRALVESLHRIRQLDAEYVIPAHGRLCSPSLIMQNLKYFEVLSQRVAGLSRNDLADALSKTPDGMELGDIASLPDGISPDAVDFYTTCHLTNLRATIRSYLDPI